MLAMKHPSGDAPPVNSVARPSPERSSRRERGRKLVRYLRIVDGSSYRYSYCALLGRTPVSITSLSTSTSNDNEMLLSRFLSLVMVMHNNC